MTDEGQQGRTDQIETIFQSIMTTQQTGVCNVERGKGGVRQTGTVIFLHGQVVEATAGGRVGIEALEWLQTWANCQYVFMPKSPAEIVISPPQQEADNGNAAPASLLSLLTQVIPRNNPFGADGSRTQETLHQESPVQLPGPTTTPLTPHTPLPPSGPHTPAPQMPLQTGYAQTQQNFPQTSGQLGFPQAPGQRSFSSATIQQGFPAQPPRTPIPDPRANSALATSRAPARLLDGPDALAFMERIRLSRLHRHIFFLLDGQRTASDLVRLTKHSLDEVQRLLSDLEQCGLIRQ